MIQQERRQSIVGKNWIDYSFCVIFPVKPFTCLLKLVLRLQLYKGQLCQLFSDNFRVPDFPSMACFFIPSILIHLVLDIVLILLSAKLIYSARSYSDTPWNVFQFAFSPNCYNSHSAYTLNTSKLILSLHLLAIMVEAHVLRVPIDEQFNNATEKRD